MRNIEDQRETIRGNRAVSQISIKGKVFRAIDPVDRIEHDIGDYDQATKTIHIDAIVVDINPNRGKTYFPEGYKEGAATAPTCYSEDSIRPAEDSQQKQATTCGVCPHNKWIEETLADGTVFKGKRCRDHQKIAVMVPKHTRGQLYLLRVPPASLKAFSGFTTALKRYTVNGKPALPIQVLTRISFDKAASTPKLEFTVLEVLDPNGSMFKDAKGLYEKGDGLELVGVEPPKLLEAPKLPTEIPATEENEVQTEVQTETEIQKTLTKLPRRRAA